MSDCSVATALLFLVAVIHIVLAVVLAVLVYIVRCGSHHKGKERRESSHLHHHSSQDIQVQRRKGTISPPGIITGNIHPPDWTDVQKENIFPLSQAPVDLKSREKAEEGEVCRNRTLVELRKESTSSLRKISSPFRKMSSPLRKGSRASLASITSKFSRKSVDHLGAEEMSLIVGTEEMDDQPHNLMDGAEDLIEEVTCNVISGSDEASHPDIRPSPDVRPSLHILESHGDESEC